MTKMFMDSGQVEKMVHRSAGRYDDTYRGEDRKVPIVPFLYRF